MGHKGARRNGQGRKAYLKHNGWGLTHVPSGVDKHRMGEVTSHRNLNWRDIAFMKLYGLHDPTAANKLARMERGERDPFLIETPRDRVLKRLSEWLQEIDPKHNIKLGRNVYLWWSHNYYFLVHYDDSTQTCRRSCRYSDRKSLMDAFEFGTVRWK